MRYRILAGWLVIFSLMIMACSFASGATPTPSGSSSSTSTPTPPPIAPTNAPPIGSGLNGSPTPNALTPSPAASKTATVTVESTSPPITPQAPPTSTGPLDFKVLLVGCRLDPSRQGGVILTFKIEASGGNGVYTYYREGRQVTQISDRPATKGTAVVDAYRVISSDGQAKDSKFNFPARSFNCP